ncbi:hypothetical protein [Proteus mirabilis]|uniref:tail fiber/spike domain-containing protein n=1 Tax=Proteus mirabilis TaxID=584 RepID=UPI001F0330FC|nr:hypothetical protein [Proteus mirabilis]
MSTIPTQNPVPSEAAKDLKFNSGKIDEFVTSMKNKYIDRFGQEHFTIEGLRWVAQQAISKFGYITLDSFQKGAEITLPNQVLRDEVTGEYYRWDGWLPKSIPVGSTPENSGGIGVGKWLSVGDSSLRSELKEKLVTKLVQTDKIKINESEITVGGSNVTFPDKDIRITNESIFIGESRIGRRIGDIYFSPFPSFELDFGEFEANGAVIPFSDPAASALLSLSKAYKMRWGIFKTENGVTLPSMYHKDGRGRYMRSGIVGMKTDDTSQRIVADIRLRNGISSNPTYNNMVGALPGKKSELFDIKKGGTVSGTSGFSSANSESQYTSVELDTGRVIRTSNETSVLDVGMTPVIYLGVENKINKNEFTFLNTDISSEPLFQIYSANPQKDNLSQGVSIRGNRVYSLHPYYQGSENPVEKGVVITANYKGCDQPDLLLQTDKGWHEGICNVVIGGEEYLLFSANNPSINGHEGNIRQTHIAKIKVSSPDNIEYIRVFDTGFPNAGSMTAPNISSDFKKITVRQVVYENGNRTNKTRIRVIDAYSLLMENQLVIDEDFTTDVNQDPNFNYGIQSTLYHKGKVLTLTGGVGTSYPSVIDVYDKGTIIETINIKCGQNLITDGFWEPEWIFSDGDDVFLFVGINKAPNRKELVYKII